MWTESEAHSLGETQPIPDRAGLEKPGEDCLRRMGFRSAWESFVLTVLSWIFIWPVRSEVSYTGQRAEGGACPVNQTDE